mmetsp:Transcript_20087/g.57069  ORF Transcript_20087/g.57069 Transcript_20087/m.57069 type:complete len:87 (+) Transcript_20087:1677-1937(+)
MRRMFESDPTLVLRWADPTLVLRWAGEKSPLVRRWRWLGERSCKAGGTWLDCPGCILGPGCHSRGAARTPGAARGESACHGGALGP